MYWPALRALSYGALTPEQLSWLHESFCLSSHPRTEGPGAAQSIAHRAFVDTAGTPLVLDLARTGESGWVFTLFHTGQQPDTATVDEHRAHFRAAINLMGLTLVEIDPPAAAEEVLVSTTVPGAESALGAHWPLPLEDLSQLWSHLGLRADAPREVKATKLRGLTHTPAWADAPASLRHEAEEFLRGN
ncbi:hypothetical protein [Streptomyces aureocirculatus]|uniref:hypothetical protein n=1 Tax=Streptomyces aureocirculatus TaxID=67275 RepID=UPI0004C730D5|nr:hypothetical protein [Streptomyces aureocirculatus]